MNINLTLFGQTIAFIVFVWFCMKYVWPPIMNALNERKQKIADGLAAAERGAHEQLHEAKQQAQEIIAQAQKRANEIVDEAKENARAEGERILNAARAEIDQAVNQAREQLRAEVVQLAVAGASRVLKREIDGENHRRPPDKGRRFLRVVADNGRLALLPEIAQLYAAQRAEAERKVQAEVVSAFPLDDAQRQALVEALKRRLGREVSLDVRVDESLIGGAIVRAGDLVIDGSVTGQLERLAHTLMR